MNKCVFFCPSVTWGGVEKNVRLRAQLLIEEGYEVYVVILKDIFREKFEEVGGLNIISVNKRGGDINITVIAQYVKILKKIKPNVVFSALKKDWFLVSLSSKIVGVPRILLYLGIKRKIKNNIKYKIVFNILKPIVIVNSDSLKNYLLSTSPFFNKKNLYRIYNGFSTDYNDPTINLKDKLGLPNDTIIIGMVGRISRQKGLDLIPSIVKKLPENYQIIHLGSGKGNYNEHLIDIIEQSSLSHRVQFLGYQENIHLFYKAFDVFLLSSRNEGMANVLNEALSHGIPAVSARVSGSEELLANGKYGILCEIEDTDCMAKGILDIVENKRLFTSKDLIKWTEQNFSLTLMKSRTITAFFGNLEHLNNY